MMARRTIRRGCALVVALTVVVAGAAAARADMGLEPVCPLLVHQGRVDLEERELDVEVAVAELAAAESIYDLVRQLWESDATERLLYLRTKRDRDVARLELKRRELLVVREETELEQYRLLCGEDDADASAGERQNRIDEALARYRQADCHRIGKDLAIAEADLAFNREWLVSVRDLRGQRVATAQDVIRAERDVRTASRRVARHERRVQACIGSGSGSGSAAGE